MVPNQDLQLIVQSWIVALERLLTVQLIVYLFGQSKSDFPKIINLSVMLGAVHFAWQFTSIPRISYVRPKKFLSF